MVKRWYFQIDLKKHGRTPCFHGLKYHTEFLIFTANVWKRSRQYYSYRENNQKKKKKKKTVNNRIHKTPQYTLVLLFHLISRVIKFGTWHFCNLPELQFVLCNLLISSTSSRFFFQRELKQATVVHFLGIF